MLLCVFKGEALDIKDIYLYVSACVSAIMQGLLKFNPVQFCARVAIAPLTAG